MLAGGRAGGLPDDGVAALGAFGQHLGVAFQLIDDLLDYTGDARATGKELLADLREGKVTYPLVLAIERDPALAREIAVLLGRPDGAGDDAARLRHRIAHPDVIRACRELSRRRAEEAIASLAPLPDGAARTALATVAMATVQRET
jgi:octaprenyl-diphosphate synthase